MIKYYIYGAGDIGKRTAKVLAENNIRVEGFIDTYKRGTVNVLGKELKIFDFEMVREQIKFNKENEKMGAQVDNIEIIIAILDMTARNEVRKMLCENGLEWKLVEEVIYPNLLPVERKRLFVADFHLSQMDDYFEYAENTKSYEKYWGEASIHKSMFDKMCTERVLELGCGHGRHVPFYCNTAKRIVLVDILEKNIEFCRNRFADKGNIEYIVNNGHDFREVADNSVTALFTYDSMVHFELMDIFNYLVETERILINGGMALFEHSNNTDDYTIDFATGYSGRNFMSAQIFAYLVNRANLEVVDQKLIDSCGREKLDCLTLVRKK